MDSLFDAFDVIFHNFEIDRFQSTGLTGRKQQGTIGITDFAELGVAIGVVVEEFVSCGENTDFWLLHHLDALLSGGG